jgi:hypothetical protein
MLPLAYHLMIAFKKLIEGQSVWCTPLRWCPPKQRYLPSSASLWWGTVYQLPPKFDHLSKLATATDGAPPRPIVAPLHIAPLRGHVGVLYPEYHGSLVTAQKSRYGQFPPAANDWEPLHPVLDTAPQLLAKEEGPPS